MGQIRTSTDTAVQVLDADTWLVIPAYNERTRLERVLRSIGATPYQAVVVDDGSVDSTAAVVRLQGVSLVRHAVNCGQGAALQTGIEFALRSGAQAIVTFDADGQHSIDDIARLLKPIRDGEADVVLGSRFLGRTENMPASRWLVLKLAVIFTRVFSRIRVTDTHNGLRAFNRRAAEAIHLKHDRMAHASEILDQIRASGLKFQESPVTIHYRPELLEKGQSSWNSLRIAGQLILGRLVR